MTLFSNIQQHRCRSGIHRETYSPSVRVPCITRQRPRLLLQRCYASAGTVNPEDGQSDRVNGQGKDSSSGSSSSLDTDALPENFCIIESRESVRVKYLKLTKHPTAYAVDFAKLQLEEISHNISSRRNRIFLLMEEVRRLRIQQRIKGGEKTKEEELGEEKFPSALPFLPPLTDANLNQYFQFYGSAVALIILFGGLLSPILEVRLGIGGTSYDQFIESMHLPAQLAQVDPIVASFCGGAVGVLSTLLIVEVNNAKRQSATRCVYCEGTGYVTCGACSGAGDVAPAPNLAGGKSAAESAPKVPLISQSATGPVALAGERCGSCSGTGRVMCIACLCTGKKVAREHDIRLDPFF